MSSPEFASAVARIEAADIDPSPQDKLVLYGLYKQATVGDVQGKRPGMLDLVGRAKYDAWAECAGMSVPHAEAGYIAEVDRLLS